MDKNAQVILVLAGVGVVAYLALSQRQQQPVVVAAPPAAAKTEEQGDPLLALITQVYKTVRDV
ncbi:MAG TPA: hypothetical protein VGD39_14780 [Nocardioides sp.]